MRASYRCAVVVVAANAAITLTATPVVHRSLTAPLPARHSATTSDQATEPVAQETATVSETSTNVDAAFDLSLLGPIRQAWARSVLESDCSYDWNGLLPGLDGRRIEVRIADLSARAMFYPGELKLVVHRYIYRSNPAEAKRLLAWETAHAVDLLSLAPTDRDRIVELYHPAGDDDHGWLSGGYEQQVGEAFMEGFVAAYCPSLATDAIFGHETTVDVAQGIRGVLQAASATQASKH